MVALIMALMALGGSVCSLAYIIRNNRRINRISLETYETMRQTELRRISIGVGSRERLAFLDKEIKRLKRLVG